MLVISGVVPRSPRGLRRDPRPARPAGPAVEGHRVQPLGHGTRRSCPTVLGRALDVFGSARPRPVHIEIPLDVLQRDAGAAGTMPIPAPAGPPVADPQALDAAAARLAAADARRSSCSAAGPADAGRRRAGARPAARRARRPHDQRPRARSTTTTRCASARRLSFAPVDGVLRDADGVLLAGAQLSDLELWGLSAPLELHGVIRDRHRRGPARSPLPGRDRAARRRASRRSRRSPPRVAPAGDDRVAQRPRRASPTCAGRIEWPPSVADFPTSSRRWTRRCRRDRIVAADSTKPAYAANHSLPLHEPPLLAHADRLRLPGLRAADGDRRQARRAGAAGRRARRRRRRACSRSRSSRPRATSALPLPLVVYDNEGYGEIRDAMDESGIPQPRHGHHHPRPARDRPRLRRRRRARADGRGARAGGRRRPRSRRSDGHRAASGAVMRHRVQSQRQPNVRPVGCTAAEAA